MAQATLSIDIEARLANLEAGMNRATYIAERNAKQIENAYSKVGSSVKSVAAIIGSAFSAAMFVNFIKGTADGLDALNDLKDATGASIENISALEDVALRTGTSFESMSSVLVKFNKVLSESKAGSETANILKSIGLNAEKLKQVDPAEALRQTAIALARFADDGNKARIIQALFGKSVQEAAPFLNDLAKQGKLNATVTTEQAEAAEAFNQQLASLRKNITDAARSILSDMIPAVNRLGQEFIAGREAFGGFFGALVNIGTSRTFDNALAGLHHYERELADLRELERRSENEVRALGNTARQEAIRADIAATEKFIRYYQTLLKLQGSAGAGRGIGSVADAEKLPSAPDISSLGKESKVRKTSQIDEASRSLAAYIDRLEGERQKLVELTEEEKALNFLKELGTTGQIPQVRELVLQLSAELDQRREIEGVARLQADANKEIARQAEAAGRAVDDLLASTPSNRLDKLLDTEGKLHERFERGEVALTQYREAIELLEKAYDELNPVMENTSNEMSEFAKEAARNIQDALGDTVLRTLKGDFDSIGELWANLIERMIAQALAANLAQALMGDFGSTGKIGGFLGDLFGLFGFAKGGAFSGGVQQFAGGGVVSSPTLFKFAGGTGLMGEAGPEAIMPLRRGRDGKLGVAAEGGGMTIINNVAAGITRSEVLSALQLTAQSLRGEFKQSLRAAGVA